MVGQRMSHPMWYNYIMKMKNEKQENLPKWGEWVMANFTALHKEAEAKKKAEGSKGTKVLTYEESMER